VTKFKLQDIERVAKDVSKKAGFPLRSQEELVDALGGKDGKFKYEGKDRKAEEAEQIPDEMFPIESEEDFVGKMASLRQWGGDEPDLPKGKEVRA
jgi:hypothetical protein